MENIEGVRGQRIEISCADEMEMVSKELRSYTTHALLHRTLHPLVVLLYLSVVGFSITFFKFVVVVENMARLLVQNSRVLQIQYFTFSFEIIFRRVLVFSNTATVFQQYCDVIARNYVIDCELQEGRLIKI